MAIAKADGIAPLVALARDGTDWQNGEAAGALAILAYNADNQVAIARAGGIAPLVALVRGGSDGQKELAAGGCSALAQTSSATGPSRAASCSRTGGTWSPADNSRCTVTTVSACTATTTTLRAVTHDRAQGRAQLDDRSRTAGRVL